MNPKSKNTDPFQELLFSSDPEVETILNKINQSEFDGPTFEEYLSRFDREFINDDDNNYCQGIDLDFIQIVDFAEISFDIDFKKINKLNHAHELTFANSDVHDKDESICTTVLDENYTQAA